MYGNPLWETWDAEKAPELEKVYQDWYLTELRWCNMGVRHPETGQGFGSKTKICSSMPLWSGYGTPDKCQCLTGPGHVTDPLNVLKVQLRLLGEAWEKINHYIFALCPLEQAFRAWITLQLRDPARVDIQRRSIADS